MAVNVNFSVIIQPQANSHRALETKFLYGEQKIGKYLNEKTNNFVTYEMNQMLIQVFNNNLINLITIIYKIYELNEYNNEGIYEQTLTTCPHIGKISDWSQNYLDNFK